MSGLHWPWPILGIAPTDDRKTIREAYARLLKALDPDAATEAFMELRDARDAALSGHFLHPPQLADDDAQADDFGLGDPLDDDDAVPPHPAPETEEKPRFTVDYSDEDEQRFQRMVELFTGEGELAPSQIEEMHAHLDTLFADDRMADLGHYARVETWLAQLLAERYPRGAALFSRIAEHFQWGNRAHELGIHPAIPWLFNAHEGHSLVHELATPGHVYHREWIELARGKPKGPLWLRAVDKQRMGNLIATIRRDYPWLEQEHWQPDLVARWEKKTANGGVSGPNPWVWMLLLAIFFAVLPRMLDGGASTGAERQAAALAEKQQADDAITAFIASRFPDAAADGRTPETLRQKSPHMYDTLGKASARFPDSAEPRDRAMMSEITDSYYYIIDKLPHEQQVADARFRARMIKALKANAPACAAFANNPRSYLRQGNNAEIVPADYGYRMFSVVHDEYGNREWPLVSDKADISGALIGKLIKRSGLPEARVRAALSSNNPPDADRCAVVGSLLELMTEVPAAEARKILPVLL